MTGKLPHGNDWHRLVLYWAFVVAVLVAAWAVARAR